MYGNNFRLISGLAELLRSAKNLANFYSLRATFLT